MDNTLVEIELDLEESTITKLETLAVSRGITLNEMVVYILEQEFINVDTTER